MKKQESKLSKIKKNTKNELILISSNRIDQSNWKSKNNETLQDWHETGEPKLDHGKLWQKTVIDMKLEYDTKTK